MTVASTLADLLLPKTGARPVRAAGGRLRNTFDAWLQSRAPRTDSLLLTHRNVYILPTRGGLLFCFTLGVLLVASINYQLNLGYVLTFLLAGSGVVSMHMTHNTLRGMTLHLRPLSPVHAGDSAVVEVVLSSPHTMRYGVGLGLRLPGHAHTAHSHANVPGGGQTVLHLGFVPPKRGSQALPTIHAETRFPLGLFRAWAVWRPAASLLVYPRLERPAPALPSARVVPGGSARTRTSSSGEFEGIRQYRRGDPLKGVAWKRSAQAMASGGELVSRDSSLQAQQQLWLDWQGCGSVDVEARLSRLAAWIVDADRRDAAWGMSLPGRDIAMGQGDAHRHHGLETLALWSA